MRLGLVGAGYETAALLSVLPLDGNELFLFLDRESRPRVVKEHDLVAQRVKQGSSYLLDQGVDLLIVPPVYESLAIHQYGEKVLPLFSEYVRQYVCPYSLVGKLGLLAGWSDLAVAEQVVGELTAGHSPTDRQQRIKSFDSTFPSRLKDVSHRQFQLSFAGRRDWMIRNLIKTDMRYFKDAAVDTLVPLDRSMLYREKQIRHRMGPKMRFHGRQALETIFSSFIPPIKQSSPAPLQIHATALPDYLLASKPWKWLLAQGKNREVQVKYIDTF